MKLLNQRVKHITYGEGIIQAADATSVTILFDGSRDGELKKFSYPICFEKFIKLEDPSVQADVDRLIRSYHQKKQQAEKEERESFQISQEARRKILDSKSRQPERKPQKSSESAVSRKSAQENRNLQNPADDSKGIRMTATAAEYEWHLSHEHSAIDPEMLRKRFVEDYPADRILNLSLNDYLIAKEGEGNDRSFCRRLRYELGWLSSMGNVRFNIFGVYHNPNGDVALSVTYTNLFGNDINAAFMYIKKQIVKLLDAAGKEDYRTIDEIKINSSFKYKLITVYYPDLYIPVVTNNVLNEYCRHVGLDINPNESMIYRNIELRNWKNRNPEICDWPNSKLMGFCDWLWRSNRFYRYSGK